MDFGLTQEQDLLRRTARDFLAKHCPKTLVRAMEVDERGFSPELWRQMAELGWLGLALPREEGGAGGSFLDLVILVEELGRALAPTPFLSTVVGSAMSLARAGNAEQRQLLRDIVAGQSIVSFALTEPSATYDASGVALKAAPDDRGYVLNGTKLFVPDAHIADYLIVVARTQESATERDGVTLFLVDARSEGVETRLLKTIAFDRQCEVSFKDVRVSTQAIIGERDKGWAVVEHIKLRTALAECAWMVGGAQQVLEMSAKYAKERVQFNRPIGSFQAIQHKCANMLVDCEGARYLTYLAAWRMSEGLPCESQVAMAKAWAGEAYQRICVEGHQVFGGVGFTREHDMQLYFRRAKRAELSFGDGTYHRRQLVQQLGMM